jgi:hypothetical protein
MVKRVFAGNISSEATTPPGNIFREAMRGVVLYDAASVQALHTRNPYAPGGGAIDLKYTVDGWSARIKALLSLHRVKLVDVHGLWVVQVGNQGPVEALTAVTDGGFAVAPA